MLRRLFTLMLVIVAAESISVPQDRSSSEPFVQTAPGDCEVNAAALDSVRSEALKEVREDTVVIVIARLGDGETSRTHIRRRLVAVKNYLRKYGLPAQRIVAADGERISGYGRVELYVAGKLRVVVLAHRNKSLCVECCDPDDADFYLLKRKGSRVKTNHATSTVMTPGITR